MLKNVTYLWDQKKHILPSCWDNWYDPFSVPLPWNPQCPELWMKCSWGENPLSLMLHGVGTQFRCESEGHRAELNMSNTVIYVIIKLLTRFSMALMVLTASLTLDLADTWVPLAITALFCSNSAIKVFFCSSVNRWYSSVLFFTRSWRTWLPCAGVAWAMTVSE